jgi:hypothetical protein
MFAYRRPPARPSPLLHSVLLPFALLLPLIE